MKKANFFWVICFTATLLILTGSSGLYAYRMKTIEPTEFFREYENIFVYRPNLIKDVFYAIMEIRGNPSQSRSFINRDVLGCYPEARIHQGCRIDKLQQLQKEQQIPRYLKIPVTFTSVESKSFTRNERILVLKWKPEWIQPPSLTTEQFLDYIRSAVDSRYYSLKPGIERIQLNPLFEKEIHIILDKKITDNLVELYKHVDPDSKDAIIYTFDFVTASRRNLTMDLFIQFRAVHVEINHQTYKPSVRRL